MVIMSEIELGILPVVRSRRYQLLRWNKYLSQGYVANKSLRLLSRKTMAVALMPRDKVMSGLNNIRIDAEH